MGYEAGCSPLPMFMCSLGAFHCIARANQITAPLPSCKSLVEETLEDLLLTYLVQHWQEKGEMRKWKDSAPVSSNQGACGSVPLQSVQMRGRFGARDLEASTSR